MTNKIKKKLYLYPSKIILSLIMFVLLWTLVTDAWGYSKIVFGEENDWGSYIYGGISRFIWAIPAIAFLRLYSNEIPTKLKALFTNKPSMRPLIISVAVMVAYHFIVMIIMYGGFRINPGFDLSKELFKFVMVAFVEELVYRGWGQNALSEFWETKKAVFISSIFFVILHLPAYFIKFYLHGMLSTAAMLTQVVMVFMLSILFGYLYYKGKSLWSPMIVHFLGDFLSVMMLE